MANNKIIYGKIITLDDKDTIAEAMYIEDGIIKFIGTHDGVQKFKTGKTLILDFGGNFIYPGFMDAHMHGTMAATQLCGYCDLSAGKNVKDYVKIIKDFIAKNPGWHTYVGTNWLVQNMKEYPTKKELDDLHVDAEIYMLTEDRHMVWTNSKVLEKYKITSATAKTIGTASCKVFPNGEPTGVFSDSPAMALVSGIKLPIDVSRKGYIEWQKQAFSWGYTAVCEAAVLERTPTLMCSRYSELAETGLFKLRTYALYLVPFGKDNWQEEINYVKDCAAKFNSEYFKIYGIKLFADGVVEARSAWLLEDYSDEPGYRGFPIIKDEKLLVDMINAANLEDLVVHVHSIGDASTQLIVNGMIKSQQQTGSEDARNAIAHLELVDKKDIERMGKNKIIACVAPMWSPFMPTYSEIEIKYLGKKRGMSILPIKSFVDANALIAFHSDYPGCKNAAIPETLYRAVTRSSSSLGKVSQRNPKECITIKQALYAMTRNVAYSFKEEKRLGTIEVGKIANFTIFDTNFLNCPVENIAKAKVVNTIVDGEIVY